MLEKQVSADRGSHNRGGGTIGEQQVGYTKGGMWKMRLPPPGQRRTGLKKHCEYRDWYIPAELAAERRALGDSLQDKDGKREQGAYEEDESRG